MTEAIERIRGRDLIRRGPFARLWWSQIISSLGDWATLFATFSLAARIAGAERSASIGILVALVARILPGLILAAVGGVLADRWDRKLTMIIADFGRGALVLLLMFVTTYRDMFIVTFMIEVLSLLRQPARESLVPQLVSGRHLMGANGLNLVASYGTAPVGSALFAAIAATRGTWLGFDAPFPALAGTFLFDAVTFVLSGLIVVSIAIPERAAAVAPTDEDVGIKASLRDMTDGFKFVTTYPAVRRVVLGMAVSLFGGGALFVLGQPFSEQVLSGSDSGYGIVVTALGVGAGLGMLGVTLWGTGLERREPLFAFAIILTGLSIIVAAFTSTVWGAAGWVFIAGLGTGVAYVTGFTHLHSVVTDDIRGRTFAALFGSARLALLVSISLAGIGEAALNRRLTGMFSSGVRMVILISGIVILISGIGELWAVRRQLGGNPLDDESYRSLKDAGDAITWIRGGRRSR